MRFFSDGDLTLLMVCRHLHSLSRNLLFTLTTLAARGNVQGFQCPPLRAAIHSRYTLALYFSATAVLSGSVFSFCSYSATFFSSSAIVASADTTCADNITKSDMPSVDSTPSGLLVVTRTRSRPRASCQRAKISHRTPPVRIAGVWPKILGTDDWDFFDENVPMILSVEELAFYPSWKMVIHAPHDLDCKHHFCKAGL